MRVYVLQEIFDECGLGFGKRTVLVGIYAKRETAQKVANRRGVKKYGQGCLYSIVSEKVK